MSPRRSQGWCGGNAGKRGDAFKLPREGKQEAVAGHCRASFMQQLAEQAGDVGMRFPREFLHRRVRRFFGEGRVLAERVAIP